MSGMIPVVGYGMIAVFGIFLSAGFCGIRFCKDSLPKLILFVIVILAVQGLCYYHFGLTFSRWSYPLLLHFPLACFLAVGYKKSWAVVAASVLLAYLCCQIPWWLAAFAYLFSENPLYHDVLYVIAIPTAYGVLHSFAVTPIQKIMNRSSYAAWGLGIFPLLYYVFDYATTVYTNALYSGNPLVAQIMPSVMSVGYILFALIYQTRLEAQETAQQEQFLLSLQLRRSQSEYAALRQMQEQTDRFHHDLRHHTSLLIDYAEKGALAEIKTYLQDLRQELDTVTFKQFCGHRVVDLLLSHFDSHAKEAGVQLDIHAEIPPTLPFKDIELCSLLSNGLENAIYACSCVQNEVDRVVSISLTVRQKNLLLSIQNPCQTDVTIVDGFPISKRSDHGIGTRSMASVVHQHGGLIHFSVADGVFLLRASLPMD